MGSVFNDLYLPMSNVNIVLYPDSDNDGNADGTAIDSTLTTASGNFAFTGVEPANYVLVERQPTSYNRH